MSSKPEQEPTTPRNDDHVAVAIPVEPEEQEEGQGANNNKSTRQTRKHSKTDGAHPIDDNVKMSMRSAGKISDSHDDELLHRAVQDAGRWAFGTILVEVWLMNEQHTQLYRPEAGWWIDPSYHALCDGSSGNSDGGGDDGSKSCQICRLTDPKRADFVRPTPLAPGVGLPGALWTEDKSKTAEAGGRHVPVVWRDVKALANDPDQPWNPRLQLLAELGLGWAAAVPLVDPDVNTSNEKQGIVIYMARDGVDGRRLRSIQNECYLHSAAHLIAAALAVRGPRHQAMEGRRTETKQAIRRVRAKIIAIRAMKLDLKTVIEENEAKLKKQESLAAIRPDAVTDALSPQRCGQRIKGFGVFLRRKTVATVRKFRGAQVKAPPSFSWQQTAITFFGVFMTILVLGFLSKRMVGEFGSDFSLVMGPFGALSTLFYGLTAAPASQPRNCMLGQLISITIALSFTYADNMNPQARTALVTALAISCMVKLGLTHPPAGATALIFSGGKLKWTHMAMSLLGNAIAIAMATLINNWTDRRQYPTFWGFGELNDFVASHFDASDDGEEDEKLVKKQKEGKSA